MITSNTNSQIKNIVKLMKSSSKRKEQGVYLVEGIRIFREIPQDELVKFYLTEECAKNLNVDYDWEEGADYEYVSDSVMKSIADTCNPQGIIAIVRQKKYKKEDILQAMNLNDTSQKRSSCILLLEHLQDPGNLGTILRTAEGAGVAGILMSEDTADIYNPKVVRATMGSIFRLPFCYTDDSKETVIWLKSKGVQCCAAHLSGTDLYGHDFRQPTCFFIGNEGSGLTDELTNLADVRLTIPMSGKVESLNAATAATVLMYEAFRQNYIS
ncbi:MAG: RNA methyltransferase [Lachnospiraceae bacterium]|nr:RNA methyltransferase [Lachnospiraceae bacterium]